MAYFANITKKNNFKIILVKDDSLKYPKNYDTSDSYDNKGSHITLMCTYYWLQAARAVSLDSLDVRTFDTLYRRTVMQFNGRQSPWYKAETPIKATPVLFITVHSVWLYYYYYFSIACTYIKEKPALYLIVIKQLKSLQPYTQTKWSVWTSVCMSEQWHWMRGLCVSDTERDD